MFVHLLSGHIHRLEAYSEEPPEELTYNSELSLGFIKLCIVGVNCPFIFSYPPTIRVLLFSALKTHKRQPAQRQRADTRSSRLTHEHVQQIKIRIQYIPLEFWWPKQR